MKFIDALIKFFQNKRKHVFGEDVQLKGSFCATIRRSNGDIETRRKDNLILNVGFDFIAAAIGDGTNRPDVMAYTAVGTGTDNVYPEQTNLVSELDRKAATYTHVNDSKVFTFTTFFGKGEATGAITEAGICNAGTGGIFIDRVVFAVINKAEDDELTTNFEFTLS